MIGHEGSPNDATACCSPGSSACCPPTDPACSPHAPAASPEPEEDADEALARFARALGHPARVAIVRLLSRRKTCICGEIVDELPLAQSTVSQHLKRLKEAGLVQGTVDGPRTCYCIDPAALERLRRLVADL